jgi:hypothetical protein
LVFDSHAVTGKFFYGNRDPAEEAFPGRSDNKKPRNGKDDETLDAKKSSQIKTERVTWCTIMKSIKKITDKVTNNVSSLAGSALLVGATLTGGAAFAAAQSGSSGSSMDLGDYPQPFVTEDGEVDTSIVIGSDAATIDVVGAVEIAGSLGNAAFGEEEVSVSGGGVAGTWSADNGVTLNRQSTNLFIDDRTADGQTRLDASDIPALEDASFQSADSNEVEIEHDLQVGDQAQQFSTEGDYDNPVLHVNNPTSPSDGDNLFQATVEFDSAIDFTEAGQDDPGDDVDDNADEWIEDGDEIELFGTEYTFSDESDDTELVLYGSANRVEVNTGESTTVTVDGEEVQLESTYVNENGDSATVVVGGQTENVEEGDSVGPSGNVRVSDIYRTGPDGQGRVAYSQGSNELVIDDNGDVELDGDDVDGVDVDFSSANNEDFQNLESMTFNFGAQESDQDFVEAGEMYEDPIFGLQFHYGGLNPDVADAENAAEVVEVDAPEDDQSTVTFTTSDGEEVDLPVHTYSSDVDNDESVFGPEDGTIAQYEGESVEEDDMVVLNSFEEADMYEVTDVSDSDLDSDVSSDAEVSVTLENVVTGESVEITEDGLDLSSSGDTDSDNGDHYTLQDESIEGKDFDVQWEGSGQVTFVRSTAGDNRQLWPWMYSSTDSAVAFDAGDVDTDDDGNEEPGIEANQVFDVTDSDFTSSLGGTVSGSSVALDVSGTNYDDTSDTIDVVLEDSNGNVVTETISSGNSGQATSVSTPSANDVVAAGVKGVEGSVTVIVDGDSPGTAPSDSSASNVEEVTRDAQVDRTADIPSGVVSNDATATVTFTGTGAQDVAGVSVDDSFVRYGLEVNNENSVDHIDIVERTDGADGSGVLFAQPENDDDEEEAYVIETNSEGSGNADVADYTGTRLGPVGLDDEDVDVAYDEFGAYTADDEESSDSETLNLHMPSAQATSGMAMTGPDGALSMGGGSGGSATAAQPTYEHASGVLDTDGNVNQVKNNENVIVVGGPNANSLTQELVDDNQTMPASDYTEGQGMIQMVDGWSSGNSALVVAGYQGEDTRAAAEFLANYRNNQDALEGQSEVTIETSSGSVVSN